MHSQQYMVSECISLKKAAEYGAGIGDLKKEGGRLSDQRATRWGKIMKEYRFNSFIGLISDHFRKKFGRPKRAAQILEIGT